MTMRRNGAPQRAWKAPELDELLAARLEGLERIYRQAPLGPAPSGQFLGRVLAPTGNALSKSWRGSAIMFPFERLRFGVDFDAGRWFFVRRELRLAHFECREHPSRWRDTNVFGLHYESSRLPRGIRNTLYDELKPLSARLCLGLGGINAPEGALFFFALVRAR